MGAGEKVLRVIIAGDALGAVTALGELSHGLEHAHSEADKHGGGITSSLGGAAKGIGLFAAGAVGAAALVAGEFYKIGSGYEQSLNQIQAFTHSTADQMKALEQSLYGMSPALAKYGLTTEDAADALSKLTKAGFTVSQGQALLIPTLTLSKAATVDAADAANVMTEAMHSFGLQTKDAQMVSDSFTNATHTSTASLGDLHDALSYSAVVSHHAGLTFNETTAFLAEMANIGIKGSKAGTALKDVLTNLEVPTSKGGAALKALGIDAYDSNGKMKDFTVIVGQLHDKMANLSDQQKNTYIKDIFGKIPLESAKQLVETGVPNYEKYIKVVGRAGEANTIAEAKSKGLSGTFNMLRATVESTVQHLYMQVAPKLAAFLTPMVEALPGALSKLGKFGKQAWDAFSQGASGGGTGGTSGMGKVFAELGDFTRNVLIPELKQMGQVFVRDVVPIVKDGLRIFEAIFPVVMHIVEALAKDLAPIVRDVGKFVEKDLLPSFKKLSEWIATDLVPKIDKMWSKLQPILAMLVAWIDKKIIPLLDSTWQKLQPIFGQLGKLINTLMDSLTGLLVILKPVLSWILDVFGGPALDAVKGFINGVVLLAKGVIEVFQGLLDFVTGVFTGNWSKAWTGIKEQFFGIFKGIAGFLEALVFGKMLKLAVEGFKAIGDAIVSPLKDVGGFMRGLWDDISKLWSGSLQGIKMIWSLTWRNVKDDFVGFVTSNWRDFTSWSGKLMDWFAALPGKLLGYLRSAGTWLVTSGLDLLEGFLNGIERGAVSTWNWLKALPGAVKGWFSDIGNWLIDAGWNMIMGMINGIQQAAGQLKDASVGVVKDAYEGVKSFLGINSPSRLYIGIGQSQGEGTIKGVQAKAAAVHDAIVSMVSPPASKFSAAFRQQSQTAASAAAANARSAGQLWASTGASGGAQGGFGPAINVTINVAGSIQAEKDFAKKMATAIRDEIRQIGRRNGGSTGLTGIA